MGVRELLLVRHGESEGNVAAARAWDDGLEVIEIADRDADVELSATGAAQAKSLGEALVGLGDDERPDAVWCSPYVRAQQTARIALDSAGHELPVRLDERLRDRELGVLDRLTRRGIEARHPEEAELRRRLGKFYHRPAGGESWADVALRVRSALTDLDRFEDRRRVLLVCHDAVVLVVRYICEQQTEAEVLELARSQPVRNVSITRLERAPDGTAWRLADFNDVSHLEQQPAPATQPPGEHGG